MNKFNSIGCAGVILAVTALSHAMMADTVQLSTSAYTSFNTGGEFTAVTGLNGTFQTFCVQTGVDFTPFNWGGPPYNYTVSLNSVGPSDDFPLAEGTAYLYSQFSKGTLSGYDFNLGNDPTDAAIRQTDAGILQSALWWLQGNQTYGGYPNGAAGNPYYDEAVAALGANVDVAATYSTDFGVQIMNLTGPNGEEAQNQLIAGVPDGGTTLGLLALSLAGLVAVRRFGCAQAL
jgi:hypothetical protein